MDGGATEAATPTTSAALWAPFEDRGTFCLVHSRQKVRSRHDNHQHHWDAFKLLVANLCKLMSEATYLLHLEYKGTN